MASPFKALVIKALHIPQRYVLLINFKYYIYT